MNKRPLALGTWASVIECAEWELAEARGDGKRTAALRRSIRFARRMVKAGASLFEPASPSYLLGEVWKEFLLTQERA